MTRVKDKGAFSALRSCFLLSSIVRQFTRSHITYLATLTSIRVKGGKTSYSVEDMNDYEYVLDSLYRSKIL